MIRRETIFQVFFLAVLITVLYHFFLLIQPFLTPLFVGLILWLVSLPIDDRLAKKWPRLRSGWRAALSTLLVLLILGLPLALAITLFAREIEKVLPMLQDQVGKLSEWSQAPTWDRWPFARHLDALMAQVNAWEIPLPSIRDKIGQWGSRFVTWLTNAGRDLAAAAAGIAFNGIFVMITLFFLFHHGRSWYQFLIELIPMRTAQKKQIAHTLRVTVVDTVRGTLLTSLCQMIIAILGYLIAGLSGAFTLGLATGVACFIPVVGGALVWVPTVIILALQGSVGKAIFVTLWGMIAIGMSDNIIRPLLTGSSAQVPLFLMILALMGGLAAYGMQGLIIGPVIVAILPLLLQIYREMFLQTDPVERRLR